MIIYFDSSMFPEAMEKCATNSDVFPLTRDIVYVPSDFNTVVFLDSFEFEDWNLMICGHAGVFFSYFFETIFGANVLLDADSTKHGFHQLFNDCFTFVDLYSFLIEP